MKRLLFVFFLLVAALVFPVAGAAQTINSPPETCDKKLTAAQERIKILELNVETLAFLLKAEKAKSPSERLSIEEFYELQRLRAEVIGLRRDAAEKTAEIEAQKRFIALLLDRKPSKLKQALRSLLDLLLK